MKRGGAAATTSAAGAKVFGGSRLKTLFGISKGGAPPCTPPPPESASGISHKPKTQNFISKTEIELSPTGDRNGQTC